MRLFLLFACAVALLTACSDPPSPSAAVLAGSFTGPEGSALPVFTSAEDGSVYLSWVEDTPDGHALNFSALAPDAGAWSPRTEIARDSTWFVNWADVPGIIAGPDGRLLAYWLERNGGGTYTYGVRYRVSEDAGQQWSAPAWLHDDRSASEHGFVSGLATAAGWQLAWLDGHQHAQGHRVMALHTRLVGWDGQLGPETQLDDRVCDCCPTTMIAPDATPLVFYRNRSDDEIRDIYYTSVAEDSTPRPLDAQNWQIAGCPVNGPAARSTGSSTAVAWFTAAHEQPRVLAAFSTDGARTFSPTIQLDEGQPLGRVTLTLRADTAYVAWLEQTSPDHTHLIVQPLTAEGPHGPPIHRQAVSGARTSGYPRLATTGSHLLLAWTDVDAAGTTRVQVRRLPR